MSASRFVVRISFLAALAAVISFLPAFGQADPSDPFDPANKRVELSARTKLLLDVISFKLTLSADKVKRGDVVRLTITGTPAKGFYTYPITQMTADQLPPDVSVKYSGIDGLKPLYPIEESSPDLVLDQLGKFVLHHDRPFTWTQDLLVEPTAKPGKHELSVLLRLQVCNKSTCYGPDPYKPLPIALEISDEAPAAPTRDVLDRAQAPAGPKVITPTAEQIAAARASANKGGVEPGAVPPGTRGPDVTNLWSFLGFAALSAFLMLLTPCVFPMIPITVNFFIKQSEKEHHNPLAMASVYSGTIIVLLTAIMLALGSVVITIANNEWFNVGLGVVLIVFALSLFGMYEIELPHFLSRYTSAREGQGGMVGTIFMAMTFTITSFTCTGPFLGLMLGSVAGVQPPRLNLVLGALVYSTTFAAPFFVLALFPSMLKKIPKSGSWLNSVKVTMGFLELGAALKFLSNADLAFFPGNPQVFNYDTVLAAWIALSLSCSLYLLGLFRLPNDDKVENIGVIRMLLSVGFLGLAIYLAPAMFGIKPAGVVGDNVVAFLPIRTGHENDGGVAGGKGGGDAHKDWYLDYDEAWKDAIDNNKLIFIDFTGTNCANCRLNEQTVFPQPQVQAEMKKYVKVALYTDSVPNRKLSKAESGQQAERNKQFQDALGDPTLPYYVIFRPDRDAPMQDGKLKGKVLGTTKGAIFDVPEFVRLLNDAQATLVAQAIKPR